MDWETFDAQPLNDKIDMLILALRDRFDRMPTEDEVMLFILGTQEDRVAVWNSVALSG